MVMKSTNPNAKLKKLFYNSASIQYGATNQSETIHCLYFIEMPDNTAHTVF